MLNHKTTLTMDFRLSTEDIELLQNYIDGNADYIAARETADRAFRLTEALRRRISDDARKALNAEASLRNRLERKTERKKKEERSLTAEAFTCIGLDSLDVIHAILHCAMRESISITREKAVLILYAVYVSWLESHREKITIEAPVADWRGPWFWRAYSHFDLRAAYGQVPKESFEKVAKANSGVAALIHNATIKYGKHTDRDLTAFYKGSEPYMKVAKKGPEDKWNRPLDPVDMYYWKHDLENGL